MDPSFAYTFPAIRGVQARHDYYVSMCPLRLIPKIFLFNEEELTPEIRAQRVLNKSRIPEMATYITDQRDSYVFSAITASVDAEVTFEPLQPQGEGANIGLLHIPMTASFIINDGQHRRAAIEMALRENPDLGDESIAVVFFHDLGLERCQQMFADLNRYAVRPSRSLGVLYDHRDERAEVTRNVVAGSLVFRNFIEMERSTLALRSRRLFTFSSVHTATCALLNNLDDRPVEERVAMAIDYWEAVSKHMPEWSLVRDGRMLASEVRQDFIHSHGVVLHALGRVGNSLLHHEPKVWKKQLAKLKGINWARSNSALWHGRAIIHGRVSKSNTNVTLTGNAIKKHLEVELTPEEQRVEDAYQRGEYEKT
jgi:DNA sulfur modification protein DndB